ncbi:MAG: hypothetical protein U0166_02645 [Acidobacteriota bacterium]
MAEFLHGGPQEDDGGRDARGDRRQEGGREGAPPAVAAALRDAKECLNPAIALAGEIKIADARGSLDARDLLRLRGRIRDAIAAGDRDVQAVRAVAHELRRLGAVPSLHVPAGF